MKHTISSSNNPLRKRIDIQKRHTITIISLVTSTMNYHNIPKEQPETPPKIPQPNSPLLQNSPLSLHSPIQTTTKSTASESQTSTPGKQKVTDKNTTIYANGYSTPKSPPHEDGNSQSLLVEAQHLTTKPGHLILMSSVRGRVDLVNRPVVRVTSKQGVLKLGTGSVLSLDFGGRWTSHIEWYGYPRNRQLIDGLRGLPVK